MPAYSSFTSLLIYTVPIAVVLLSFATVTVDRVVRKRRQVSRRSANLVGVLPVSSHGNTTSTLATGSSRDGRGLVMVEGRPPPPMGTGNEFRRRRSGMRVRSHKYLVLALLTASVTVCYLPRTAYFVVKMCLPSFGVPAYFEAASILYSCEVLVDPILFTLTLDQLWEALKRLLWHR